MLGIRAVLAVSFERIHRSNLIGMGILPLRFASGANLATLDLRAGDKIEIDAPAETLAPHYKIAVRIVRANGEVEAIAASAAVETQLECRLLRSGGIIPLILQQHLAMQEA